MRLEDLVVRAAQFDENLARDIKDYVHGRKYGLVYEASKPEFVRMWKKTVVRGDLVNILPPRGQMEKASSENEKAEEAYKVVSIKGKKAKLYNEATGDEKEASVDDIVALARFDRPIYAGLKEVDRIEKDRTKPYNVVINGENFHALQALMYAYQGVVDCIYIDPPYNSGAKDWKYNNNYVGEQDSYRHSKWLTFMEDRLKLAKKLLNPLKSSMIVTIDEKEYLRLGLLLEQLFPEASIQMVSITNNPAGTGRSYEFARVNEYVFIVRLGKAQVLPEYEYGSEHKSVLWDVLRRSEMANIRANKKSQFFPIFINDSTGKIHSVGDPITPDVDINSIKAPKGCTAVFPIRDDGIETSWSCKKEELEYRIQKGYVRVGKKTPQKPQKYSLSYIKTGAIADIESGKAIIEGYAPDGSVQAYYSERRKKNPPTVLSEARYDARTHGKYVVNAIVGDRFDYPKSVYAVLDCLRFLISDKKDALIVDFFAGSGTTMHAVNLLNSIDNGQRRCICVTNNEVSAKEVKKYTKLKLRQGDPEWEKFGIAKYITWPRIKGAIEGVDVEGRPLEGNYGCNKELYEEYEGDVIDPKTEKLKRKKLYDKVKQPSYPELADHKLADGFSENAIFFDLEYLEPSIVSADLAYEKVAPILWMCGGCNGKVLERNKGYSIGDTYAILFETKYTKQFLQIVKSNKNITCVFIVTDAAERYRSMCMELPGRRVMQLYESYLRSFEINAIG